MAKLVQEDDRDANRPVTTPAEATEELKRRDTELTRLNERLQDLDRAKTEFFTNVSREIRTPLTLLLGPLQDILDSPASALAPNSRTVLEVAQGNALRLLKLADTLPDFYRIEGGRAGAAPEPTDLAAFTAELAGNFRSACDWAGLTLIVDCPPLPEQFYLDRDVWEKIVLNLVANAFKSTVKGNIEVRLRAQDGNVKLSVRDTGTGIPESELHYVFDHFHSDAGARTGTSERIGFGLAFVRELVQLANGSIDVHSKLGRGTTFTVLLPLAAHQSPVRPGARAGSGSPTASAPMHASAFAAEALLGRPGAGAPADAHLPATAAVLSPRGRVVIAEDNAEMRAYLSYVLEAAGFTVDALADGTAALVTCQARPPDAVVSDVAMPGLDGFGLIERLRADERTAVIPVLLLSGRAGEDSRIEGIAAGADDYLVKPLSSRELVARVEGAVRLARLRRETARREQADFEALFSMAPDGIIVVGHNGKVLTANERAQQLFGYSLQEFQGLQIEALLPEDFRQAHVGHRETYMRAQSARRMRPIRELRGLRRDGSEFIAEIGLVPLHFKNQNCTVANVHDISERKQLETERAEHEKRFRTLSRRLVEVQEAERRILSTELHDRTSPGLAAIQINLKILRKLLSARGTEDVRALLDDTAGLLADTTVSIREISSNLRPTVLDDGGLLPALAGYAQQFMQRTGILVHLQTQDATSALTPAMQSSLFRIVQEALTNCARHAKAKNITIRLNTEGHRVSLMIADDGVGFDFDRQSTPGLGLLTMRERAEFAGGSFSLETKPGLGTRIQVLV
jgi:PAS domain S-box-containing protein